MSFAIFFCLFAFLSPVSVETIADKQIGTIFTYGTIIEK